MTNKPEPIDDLDPNECANLRYITREIGECAVNGCHCSIFDGDCEHPEDYKKGEPR